MCPDDGLHIYLLGGFSLQQKTETIGAEGFRLRKSRDLIKLLAMAPRHRMQRDQILEWLWPDHAPAASANSLYQTLFSARHVLGNLHPPGNIGFEMDYLTLSSNPLLWVDVEAFEAAAAQALHNHLPSQYEAALSLYSGELLPENRYDEWAIPRREALQQTYRNLLLSLAHLQENLGEYQAAIPVYQRLITDDPLSEEAHAGLMRSFAHSGMRSQALRQYDQLQEILKKNWNIEPNAETKELHRMILAGK